MAWVRIHDGAMSHPKLVGLINWRNPFCVWVWGLSYCQQHLTDGKIPAAAIPNSAAMKTATKLVTAGAWHWGDNGFQVHDYLDWNDSKEVVTKKRTEAKERMKHARQRSSKEVRENFYVVSGVENGSFDSEKGSGEKPASSLESDTIADRAGRLLDHYSELYSQHRNGARLRLMGNSLEFQQACDLVKLWDDARLEKLAVLVLTTDNEWIARTDRSFKIFALKSTWADDALAVWEATRKAAN